jgi:predicted acylesterase/phospholipase RssA
MQKLALVLSGGGFKGAFQLGALEYLRDNWQHFATLATGTPNHDLPVLRFDIVSGVSVGSLNGFLVAMNRFDKLVEIDAIAANNCLYKCGFVPLDTGLYQSPYAHEFADDAQLCNAVLASTSMPVVWSPVPEVVTTTQIHKDCVDGGIVDVSPLGDVIKAINKQGDDDEYTILIINNSNGHTEPDSDVHNIAQIAVRSLADIAITEIFNNDLKEFLTINSILQQQGLCEITYGTFNWTTGTTIRKRRKRFKAIIIQPETTLGDTLQSTPEAIQSHHPHDRYMVLSSGDFSSPDDFAAEATPYNPVNNPGKSLIISLGCEVFWV